MEPDAGATLTEEEQPSVYDNGVTCSHNRQSAELMLREFFVLPHAQITFDKNSKRTSHRTAML